MNRMEALQTIVDGARNLPVVATCAATSREMAAVGDHDNHLYLLDAMGLTSSVGVGLALALKDSPIKRAVVVDGDGSLLMNLGSLATIGYLCPRKLVLVVLDNGVYASTAGIPTYTERIDLGRIAEACGIAVMKVDEVAGLGQAIQTAIRKEGPHMIHAWIDPGNMPGTPLLLQDPVVLAARFAAWLRAAEVPQG